MKRSFLSIAMASLMVTAFFGERNSFAEVLSKTDIDSFYGQEEANRIYKQFTLTNWIKERGITERMIEESKKTSEAAKKLDLDKEREIGQDRFHHAQGLQQESEKYENHFLGIEEVPNEDELVRYLTLNEVKQYIQEKDDAFCKAVGLDHAVSEAPRSSEYEALEKKSMGVYGNSLISTLWNLRYNSGKFDLPANEKLTEKERERASTMLGGFFSSGMSPHLDYYLWGKVHCAGSLEKLQQAYRSTKKFKIKLALGDQNACRIEKLSILARQTAALEKIAAALPGGASLVSAQPDCDALLESLSANSAGPAVSTRESLPPPTTVVFSASPAELNTAGAAK